MNPSQHRVAYLTAGAGGMYCGSCLHDNTLARALIRRGVDTQLIPTYTPVRTDEENISEQRVFLGGINVFLDQTLPGFRFLPTAVTRFLDQPWLIRWATRRASATSASSLGALTVSMLRGAQGFQQREMEQLVRWLSHELRPQIVVLSNILIAGCLPQLKQELSVPALVTLQGDDIFLESLPEPYRTQSLATIRGLVDQIDGFLVNSRYYADYMRDYLGLPQEKLHLVPLGLDLSGFPASSPADDGAGAVRPTRPPAIGYLARLAPEKGLHVLVDAFVELRRRGTLPTARLQVAGWMGAHHRAYVEEQHGKLRAAGLAQHVDWIGEVDRAGKIAFLRNLDVLSVPTTYREPKGLYVLEALAAGVPVVQPAHGAFPELLHATGGGRLVPAGDSRALAEALESLLQDEPARQTLARQGQATVHQHYHADAMASAVWEVLRRFLTD